MKPSAKPNTLQALVLVLGAGLLSVTNAGCVTSPTKQPSPLDAAIQKIDDHGRRDLKGRIVAIDEDSFPVGAGYGGANFSFENLTVEADGRTYKIVLPMPGNYRVGEEVVLTYSPVGEIGEWEIVAASGYRQPLFNPLYVLQHVRLQADGIVVRDPEGN